MCENGSHLCTKIVGARASCDSDRKQVQRAHAHSALLAQFWFVAEVIRCCSVAFAIISCFSLGAYHLANFLLFNFHFSASFLDIIIVIIVIT